MAAAQFCRGPTTQRGPTAVFQAPFFSHAVWPLTDLTTRFGSKSTSSCSNSGSICRNGESDRNAGSRTGLHPGELQSAVLRQLLNPGANRGSVSHHTCTRTRGIQADVSTQRLVPCALSGAPSSSAAATAKHTKPLAILEAFFTVQREQYLKRNATSQRSLDLVNLWQRQAGAGPVAFDHVAFRTFGVADCGIQSVSAFLEDFGYLRRDALSFPGKKLNAFWFSPPPVGGSSPPSLPRVFVSELAVGELSSKAQDVILRYANAASPIAQHVFGLSLVDPVPWERPTSLEYLTLLSESEYAAWTLLNGYSLNHTTLSVHSLTCVGAQDETGPGPIERLNGRLQAEGVQFNQQGGLVKVSPDGLLLQSSTVADSAPYEFSDGVVLDVPLSYMEFALRLVLPQHAQVPPALVQESQRREGFEVGNADKIFESTNTVQESRIQK